MSSLCLRVLAVCLCFHQTFGIVHQLYSSLEITNRAHGCTNELLTLTCNATGAVIVWNVGSVHLRFDSTNGVDTIHRREEYITAFLLKIIDSSGEVSKMNFLSIIFINATEAAAKRILPNDITCSSDTHNDTFFGSIADIPLPPQFIGDGIACFGINNQSSQCRIQWREPANNDSFDLDHYQLSVGSDVMNIDAKENTVIISVQIVANISLGIIAVDRCGVKSASSSITLPVNSSNYCTDGIVKPSTNLTQQNIMSTSCAQSSGVSAAFAILVLIIIALFVISIVLVIFVIILSRKEREEVELSSVHYGGLHEDGDDQKHNDDQDLEVTNGSGCTDGETPHEGSSKLNVSGNNVGEQYAVASSKTDSINNNTKLNKRLNEVSKQLGSADSTSNLIPDQ